MSLVWDLIKSGRYGDACVAADKESAQSASMLPLRNKVFALLNLGRYEESARVCREIIDRTGGESDSDYVFLGTSYWLLAKHGEAVGVWQSATNTRYTDAAGGVQIPLLLLYASAKLPSHELRIRSLNELETLRKRPAANWPGPIADYVLGKVTEDGVRSKMGAQPALRARQNCQAVFYFGVMRLIREDTIGFGQFMLEACAQGTASLMEQEYYLATGERESGMAHVSK